MLFFMRVAIHISNHPNMLLLLIFHSYHKFHHQKTNEKIQWHSYANESNALNTSPMGACINKSAYESLGVGALLITTSLSPLK